MHAPDERGLCCRGLIWLPPRQELAEDGVNTFAMRSDVSLDDAGWGSPTFHKMARLWGRVACAMFLLTLCL
jgi:hypothetical protein